MSTRLRRIEHLVTILTITATLLALASRSLRPLGVAIGGGMALLDFVVIRRLATTALARRPSVSHIVPLALAKSVALIVIPAGALLLPATLIDGVSFAVGVSALPLAIVIDALTPLPLERA
jgi:hypothetical protein